MNKKLSNICSLFNLIVKNNPRYLSTVNTKLFTLNATNSSKFFQLKPQAKMFSKSALLSHHAAAPIIQVDDLNKTNKNKDEVQRCKLASLYRLVDVKGWSWNIYNHITVRSLENPDHFLINPYGLLYEEITASKLLKIDSKCNIIEQGSTTYGVNKAGFTLHSTIHEARNDINAIIHIHTNTAAGLSALKHGILPISQEALICGRISYHNYEGILIDEKMRKVIASDLGPKNKIFVLRNHGVVFCGNTIEEAFFWLITFMTAVDIQSHAMSAANGIENLIIPPERVLAQVQRVIEVGVNEKSSDGIDWRLGDMEIEAEMRRLDRMGYNTGYPYKKKLN